MVEDPTNKIEKQGSLELSESSDLFRSVVDEWARSHQDPEIKSLARTGDYRELVNIFKGTSPEAYLDLINRLDHPDALIAVHRELGVELDNNGNPLERISHPLEGNTHFSIPFQRVRIEQIRSEVAEKLAWVTQETPGLQTIKGYGIAELGDHDAERVPYYLVEELKDYISPIEFLKKNKGWLEGLNEGDLFEFIDRILKPIQCLHAYNLVHLDISPFNILLRSSDLDVKIFDFETVQENGGRNHKVACTPLAPDRQYKEEEAVSMDLDIHNLAVTLMHLLNYDKSFTDDGRISDKYTIYQGALPNIDALVQSLSKKDNLSRELINTLKRATEIEDPNKRFENIKEFRDAIKEALELSTPSHDETTNKLQSEGIDDQEMGKIGDVREMWESEIYINGNDGITTFEALMLCDSIQGLRGIQEDKQVIPLLKREFRVGDDIDDNEYKRLRKLYIDRIRRYFGGRDLENKREIIEVQQNSDLAEENNAISQFEISQYILEEELRNYPLAFRHIISPLRRMGFTDESQLNRLALHIEHTLRFEYISDVQDSKEDQTSNSEPLLEKNYA